MLALTVGAVPAAAQRTRLTLDDAIRTALASGPAAALARADSIVTAAGISVASAFPDPVLATGYTKDTPQYHAEIEQPIDIIARGSRIGAARADTRAASYRLTFAYDVIRRDVTAAYVRAVAAERRLRLSERATADAAELVRIATVRRDAGDASDLDVGLARLSRGEIENQLQADSTDALDALLQLQLLLGLDATEPGVMPIDSLELIGTSPDSAGATPPAIAVAEAEARARETELVLRRRERFPTPVLRAGFDANDPDSGSTELLPTFGIGFSLPVFDRNRGAIAQAEAGALQARLELAAARRSAAAEIARAERNRVAAGARLERDRALVADAEGMAGLVTAAYREGAYPLASVLEAQRTVRDTLTRYLEDLAAFLIAGADYALATGAR